MWTAFLTLLVAAPPADGLSQRFEVGETFIEALDVRVVSDAAQAGGPATVSSYVLTMESRTESVDSAAQATIYSKVLRVTANTRIGDAFDVHYDSSEGLAASPDDDEMSESEVQNANVLKLLWAGYRGVGVERQFMTDGRVVFEDAIGLPLDIREKPQAKAFEHSLTSPLSWTLPAGPLESWTDEVEWSLPSETLSLLRLYNYVGRNEDGLDRIDVSVASAMDDNKSAPEMVGRGTLLFSRELQRITSISLLLERKQPRVTRTEIVWRLQPTAVAKPILAE